MKFPFSSLRKRMSVVIELEDGKSRLVSKGASEIVLAACNTYLSKSSGEVSTMDTQLREKVERAIETMAGRALRTICLAYKDISPREDLVTKDKKGVFNTELHDLTLVAILGIKDILR